MTMRRAVKDASSFAEWFRAQAARLRDSPDAAAEVANAIEAVDSRLGVEVSRADREDEDRELIITGYSEPAVFGAIGEIVDLLGEVPAWSVVALKPPRGFGFNIRIGSTTLGAADLRFRWFKGVDLGLVLIPPTDVLRDLPPPEESEEIGWLIVETGIGERAAALVDHVEFGEDDSTSRPISELGDLMSRQSG